MSLRITSSKVNSSRDIARVRTNARVLARELKFSEQDQTRIATAVSEITRNSIQYAGAAIVDFELDDDADARIFRVVVRDNGEGIGDLDKILAGDYRSATGMGMGLVGSKRLMDVFDIETGPSGTEVAMGKFLPNDREVGRDDLGELAMAAAAALQSNRNVDPVAELEHQNGELLYSLQELRAREEMLERSNQELKEVTERLSEALDRSRFLMQEIHHRVKNNLQIIGSLVSMHLRRARHKETSTVLGSLAGRIRAFGFIHDQLYKRSGDGSIDLHEYLSAICESLQGAMVLQSQNIDIRTKVEPNTVDLELAQDIGLIVNELITNACKHAFADNGVGRIDVTVYAERDRLILAVSDNGVGMADDTEDDDAEATSLGMRVLESTVQKLQGTLEFDDGDGLTAKVSLPAPPPDARSKEFRGLDSGANG